MLQDCGIIVYSGASYCGHAAFLLFGVLLGTCCYWYIVFKYQKAIKVLLPVSMGTLGACLAGEGIGAGKGAIAFPLTQPPSEHQLRGKGGTHLVWKLTCIHSVNGRVC